MGINFHGIDMHKRYATISVRDQSGEEINFIVNCTDVHSYVSALGENDVVCIEAASGSFYWADQIEKQGAICHIVDPFRFKIIRDSWCKTDKKDSRNLSLALWMMFAAKECMLPIIFKPEKEIRDLRRLFTQYELLNKQIRQYKNTTLAILHECGIVLSETEKEHLFNPKRGLEVFESFILNQAERICVLMNIYLLWNLFDQKEILKREIYKAGTPFKSEIELLVTIKGVTPLLALAFLSDIGDITRFSNVRGFSAYLGVAPRIKSSGGKTRMGTINKSSRHLSRSLFTQSITHFISSSPFLQSHYENLKNRRGAPRARIALIRKLFATMRSMLLSRAEYKWKDNNSEYKMHEYEMELNRMEHLARAG